MAWTGVAVLLLVPARVHGSAQCQYAGDGTDVYGEWKLTQDEYETADGLFCQSYNEEVDINGWFITVNKFNGLSCNWGNTAKEINIDAGNGFVDQDEQVTVKVTQYLDTDDDVCDNTMGMRHVQWEDASKTAESRGLRQSAIPAHRWRVERPVFDPDVSQYRHRLQIINEEDIDTNATRAADLFLSDVWTLVSATQLHSELIDLSSIGIQQQVDAIPHPTPAPLLAGQRWTIDLWTPNELHDGFIYFTFIIDDGSGTNGLAEVWGGHRIRPQIPYTPGDFDGDGDIDLVDYARFAQAFTGP